MTTREQIDRFYRFATDRLATGGSEKSIDELYDQWRYENPTPDELEENVAAVRAAIDDMNTGDTGRDAAWVEQKLRDELNLPAMPEPQTTVCPFIRHLGDASALSGV